MVTKGGVINRIRNLRYKYQKIFHYTEKESIVLRALDYAALNFKEANYLEFGVYRGGSIIPAYLFAKYAKYIKIPIRFFAFDSFKGLPEPSQEERKYEYYHKGNFFCSRENFDKILRNKGIKDITIIEGLYEDVLNDELRSRLPIKRAEIVMIDCDLYSSTKCVLNFIKSYLQDGTILIFDEWFNCQNKNLSEQKAAGEWLKANPNIILTPYHPYGCTGMSFIVNLLIKEAAKSLRG